MSVGIAIEADGRNGFTPQQWESSKRNDAFAEIQGFESWARKNLQASVKDRTLISLVDLGSVSVGGNEFKIAYGLVEYRQRFIDDPKQPYLLRWAKNRVLTIIEPSGEHQVIRPLAYRKDLDALSSPVLGHVLRYLEDLREGRVFPNGRLIDVGVE